MLEGGGEVETSQRPEQGAETKTGDLASLSVPGLNLSDGLKEVTSLLCAHSLILKMQPQLVSLGSRASSTRLHMCEHPILYNVNI